jgi:Predicted ATPase
VGGLHRHEYAVLGPSVNLSARLMNLRNHPGILVDDAVRNKVRSINFIPYPPVKAKGYTDPVPVFKPLSSKEARWGSADPKFVGRRKELNVLCDISKSVTRENNPPRIVFIWGESGSGKSSFIVQAIAKVRSVLLSMRKRIVITRNISSEGDMLVPFSLFRSIFRDVLHYRPKSDNSAPESKWDASSTRGRDWDGNSLGSGSSHRTDRSNAIVYLKEMCEEMNAPAGFLELVGRHLLGDSDYKELKAEPKLEEIISFMADVFIKSISTAEGVILALDDVQWMDSLSWKVLQCIIGRKQNLVLICASRPINHHSVTLERGFWQQLFHDLKKLAVFSEMTIGRLDASDVREMASIVLSCDPCDIDNNFCDDIFTHSGGMPYFASEILENCMKNEQYGRLGNGKIGWKEECLKVSDVATTTAID